MPAASGDPYGFREPVTETFSSGCTLLDCVLGGGWAYNRVANIIGDKSTGKTLLAIEACANFARENPKGKIVYVESEAAFDEDYAQALGLPRGRVEFPNNAENAEEHIQTIEDLFEDLDRRCAKKSKQRTLYIVDSMDALSDRDEVKRDIDASSYGQSKPKKLSELFRRMIVKFRQANTTLIVISQVRDNIGVAFGDKFKRSGGRALDFYASHSLWLAHMGQIKLTRHGVQRTVGVEVKAACKKNKIGPAFRECKFPLLFGYGVEDVQAGIEWLLEVKRIKEINMTAEGAKKFITKLDRLPQSDYSKYRKIVADAVRKAWKAIEGEFSVGRRKYV